MPGRIKPKRHGPLSVTPDLVSPLDKIQEKVAGLKGVKLSYRVPESEPLLTSQYSMENTGREVGILIEAEDLSLEQELGLLWNIVVPLRFTPFSRYPIPGPRQSVFHFLGPWGLLYERLLAEGRGELAWPSVCVAAQCDAGVWKGDKRTERSVQAQLHRTGINCGPVDGIIGPRTVSGLKAAQLSGLPFEEIEKELLSRPTGILKKNTKNVHGHLVIQNTEYSVSTFGRIASTRVNNGTAFAIQGPGRIVIDVD